jgi:hypothetical protein
LNSVVLPGNTKCSMLNTIVKKVSQTTQAQLKTKYAAMSKLTAPECAHVCRIPFSCCSPEYCETTIQWAAERWGVRLKRVNGKNARGEVLPLLGTNGCTAEPHLRPLCTVHTCDVNGIGCKRGDPKWTRRYFQLREALNELEYQFEQEQPKDIKTTQSNTKALCQKTSTV